MITNPKTNGMAEPIWSLKSFEPARVSGHPVASIAGTRPRVFGSEVVPEDVHRLSEVASVPEPASGIETTATVPALLMSVGSAGT